MTSLQTSSASFTAQAYGHSQAKGLPLEDMISYLLAAKRSLSSITHVRRAEEIVTAARSALEESVVVSARTSFIRRGLNNQLRLLYNVRSEVEAISSRGREEFSEALQNLDDADARLRGTLDLLRETIVHASFRPNEETEKSLHDFVDERGVEELHVSLKSSIDRTNTARGDLETSNREFDDELHSTRNALHQYRSATKLASSRLSASGSSSSASELDLRLSSLPGMLRSLEAIAQDMAHLLSSLVSHFDLCVKAVKHTEGGGAAAQSIAGDLEQGIDTNFNAPLSAMTEEEYQEMLLVLVKDAAEAEDVVLEVQDRIGEMEPIYEQVIAQRDALLTVSKATLDVHNHLSSLASTRLPRYISQAHNFAKVWSEENDRFASGLNELSDLQSLYEGFLNAYDSLILEVARRNHVRQRVEKVLRDTKHKLNLLYEEDVTAREAFRVDQGDFLPSDIWPGIGLAPMKVKFSLLAGGQLQGALTEEQEGQYAEPGVPAIANDTRDDGEGEVIPQFTKDFIEQAYGRLKARDRNFV